MAGRRQQIPLEFAPHTANGTTSGIYASKTTRYRFTPKGRYGVHDIIGFTTNEPAIVTSVNSRLSQWFLVQNPFLCPA
jgi:hypothetical protein